MVFVNILMVVLLIIFTAFFVAAEFAMVKVRSTKIDQFVLEGRKGAVAAKKVTSNLDEYLSACQLGITVTAMGLGWLGEPTIERLLHPLFHSWNINSHLASVLSLAIAFLIMTYLHVVVGELAPKTFAIQKAEKVTLLLSQPLIWFYKMMYPFIRLLNGSARFLTRLFGLKPVSEHEMAHSEEELRLILSESYQRGEINQAEFKYVNNIFEFDNRLAKEIMVPRTEVIGLHKEASLKEHIRTIQREQYTRYPVFGEDKDEIIGMVNVKDFFIRYLKKRGEALHTINSYIRPVIQVIETIPIRALLVEMQKKRSPMAVLYDEYGGTAGIVTIEDILEEIVGEIRDEYDEDEHAPIQHISDTHKIVDGKVLIYEINVLLDLHLDDKGIDTISGWIMAQNYHLQEGESLEVEGYEFKVLSRGLHYMKQIEIKEKKE
ncbi:hemolysin family protein [Priestia taiwanensis]|uniref:Membrane protein n=1 Tax=Priestia taiwanensis TaxID=1347902 RepID=A0A917EKI5_9BACI|nr:hemolysin family protein [Priestia taiwanensis]MBM7361540.1 CBS domain containing-hemolysin-like protein [Priestia taiwanensis]GGE54988.1 membrane protein [Priestia taiwanensis]